MSDLSVLKAIQAMELRLEGDPSQLDASALEEWNREFQAEVATAERGPEWPAIVARGQALATKIEVVLKGLSLKSAAVKQELASNTRGKRALKAYAPRS